jgi:hypothetical protein
MPTAVLITGYARAGKDTLAAGFLDRAAVSTRPIAHINFADVLKTAANSYLSSIGLFEEQHDFRLEAFKVRHRRFLVEAGTFARSIDRDVFAIGFVEACRRWSGQGLDPLVVCSDLRYLNELMFVKTELADWRVVTVRVDTTGIEAANEEEGKSIGEMTRAVPFDVSFKFLPDSAQLIKAEGKNLCRSFGY